MNTVDGGRLIRPGNFGEDLSCIELEVETYIWTEIYSLEACPLTKTDLKSLDFVINKFFMKLFRTNNIDTVKICQSQFSYN